MPLFVASIFLLSGLSILIPLALHLLHRRRPQPMKFAAVRFMREAIARSRRSHRLTQGVTLLLRIVLLLLIALAFSQPYLQQSRYLPAGRRKLLVVLDATASMQARDGDKSYFDKGRAWIEMLLDGLSTEDSVAALVVRHDDSQAVCPPVSDVAPVKSLLADASCSYGGADIAAAIEAVFSQDKGQLTEFELHVFSDFQRGSWVEDSIRRLAETLRERHCAVFLNSPSSTNCEDAGLVAASFMPSAIVGDGPFSCTYQVSHTETYSGSLTARLIADGQEQDQLTMVLPGAELSDRLTGMATATSSRQSSGPETAELTGMLVIDEDSYPLNDCRYFSLARLSGRPALVVNGSGDSRDSYFLSRALNPGGQMSSVLVPTEKDWAGLLNTTTLADYAMVFVCNPPAPDSTAIAHLRRYVEDGGLLVMFPGNLNGLTSEALQALLGDDRLVLADDTQTEEQGRQISAETNSQDRFLHRLTTMLPPPWSVSFRRRLSLSAQQRFLSFVTADSYDGNEFMVRSKLGKGEIMVCSLSANRDWSDLPLKPFFFVLIQELSRYGAGYRRSEQHTTVGGELMLPLQGTLPEGTKSIAATLPNGRQGELSLVLDGSGSMIVLSGFTEPGITCVKLPWGSEKQIAVNLPETEDTLTYWLEEELTQAMNAVPVAFSRTQEQLRNHINRAQRLHPLWPWLLLAAFFLSMVEVIYANLRSRPAGQPRLISRLLKKGGEAS